jgi:hypothetical protein
MTVKVAGYWDIWFQHKEHEFDVSWRFMLRHFGVSEVCLMPNLNLKDKVSSGNPPEVLLIEMDKVEDVLDKNKELVPVIIDERGTVTLKNFKHPEDAIYIFGRTGFNPLDTLTNWPGITVRIEGVDESSAWLHPHQACSIVLYDRLVKQWQ